MEWEYGIDGENGILEVRVKGELSRPALNEMARHNLGEIRKLGFRKCLLDYRAAAGALSPVDVYERPKDIREIGITTEYRIALLVPPGRLKDFGFSETVYQNNNYAFKVFPDREGAIGFLSGE